MPETDSAAETCGYVYAASGADYVPLAVHAARSLRAVCPDASIDLFTDVTPEGADVFDRVIELERSWYRPKFEALRRSRFDRTIYMDTDTFVLADPGDVFEVLERFDLVGAHNGRRGNKGQIRFLERQLPNAFPQINSGMMGVRRSNETTAFLAGVESWLEVSGQRRDQVPLRELLFESDLRVWVLPPEYNLMYVRHVDRWGPYDAAPRILHLQRLHRHIRHGREETQDLRKIVGHLRLAKIAHMLSTDPTLEGRTTANLERYFESFPGNLFSQFHRLADPRKGY